jgi:hypothetical protein
MYLFVVDQYPKPDSLVGIWFQYGYFASDHGPRFLKERVKIKRHPVLPWRLYVVSSAVSEAGKGTIYRGQVRRSSPFLYCTCFEPIYGDRTYEIWRQVLDTKTHNIEAMIGLHLGKSYVPTVHTACAVVLTRTELDPRASAVRSANSRIERSRFAKIVGEYFSINNSGFCLNMK